MAAECLRARAAYRSFDCHYPRGAANMDLLSEASTDVASLAAPRDLLIVTDTTTRPREQQHMLKLAHPDIACSYYNLGIILAESGRAELAMQYLDAFVDWVGHNFSCQSWHSPSANTLAPSIILDPDVSTQICIALETVARLHLSLTVSVTRALQALKLSRHAKGLLSSLPRSRDCANSAPTGPRPRQHWHNRRLNRLFQRSDPSV